MVRQRLRKWTTRQTFSLALEKIQLLLLNKERVPAIVPIQVSDVVKATRERLLHQDRIEDEFLLADRAAVRMFTICRLLTDVSGPYSVAVLCR